MSSQKDILGDGFPSVPIHGLCPYRLDAPEGEGCGWRQEVRDPDTALRVSRKHQVEAHGDLHPSVKARLAQKGQGGLSWA